MIRFNRLSELDGVSITSSNWDFTIREVHFDSRKIPGSCDPHSDAFIAIKGIQHDGHDFLETAHARGIRNFIVQDGDQLPPVLKEGCNVAVVPNSIQALQYLARLNRENHNVPIIGITGSNGKTIVKEWLSVFLSRKYVVAKNLGSYNSQLGVALSVLRLNEMDDVGVFEAGISQTGEMEVLEAIIKPSIGILTNIGSAHDGGFQDRKEKIREKLKLFQHCEVIVFRLDEPLIREEVLHTFPQKKLLGWASESDSELKVRFESNRVQVLFDGGRHTFDCSFHDDGSLENLVHCIVVLLHFGFSTGEIQEGIRMLSQVEMRMEIKDGVFDSIIIDDTYNNDLEGIENLLSFAQSYNASIPRTLIVTDLEGLKSDSYDVYLDVERLVSKFQVDNVIGIGSDIMSLRDRLPKVSTYETTDQFVSSFEQRSIHDQLVLVKGARSYSMERVVRMLTKKSHSTILLTDLSAIIHNLNWFRTHIKPSTKLMVMVKAFAYGSGQLEIARLMQYHNVDYLGVAYADEAVELRRNGITLPIMVMNPTSSSFQIAVDFDLQLEIYSLSLLKELSLRTDKQSKPILIHLKFDTGMHRLGLVPDSLNEVTAILDRSQNIQVEGVFTHLSMADDPSQHEFTMAQIEQFRKLSSHLTNSKSQRPLRHILNTSGIINYPEHQFDMVRLGIGLYGLDPTGKAGSTLQPAHALLSTISQVREVKKNDFVGYGNSTQVSRDSRIATVAVGYADGFRRSLGNAKGGMYINGHFAPTIGNVCMDMTMIDITGLEVREGDEVEIFGPNHPVASIANEADTIPYEILTSVGNRVKRIYKYM